VFTGINAVVTRLSRRKPLKTRRFRAVVSRPHPPGFYPKLLSGLVFNSLKGN